jgi:hypothetical protein
VSSLLEAKYTVAKGITVKTTWDSQNVVTVEEAFDSKLFKGSKSTITKAFNKGGSLFDHHSLGSSSHLLSTSDLKFKHEFSTDKLTTEHTFNFAELSSSTVFNFDNINLGASAVYDFSKGGIKSHAFAAQLTQSDTVFNATLWVPFRLRLCALTPPGPTATRFRAPFSTRPTARLRSVPSSASSLAAPTTLFVPLFPSLSLTRRSSALLASSMSTRMRSSRSALPSPLRWRHILQASLDKKLLLGLAYTQKLRAGVSLTLASQVDVNSLAADRHRLGASLTFEN